MIDYLEDLSFSHGLGETFAKHYLTLQRPISIRIACENLNIISKIMYVHSSNLYNTCQRNYNQLAIQFAIFPSVNGNTEFGYNSTDIGVSIHSQ